MFSKNVALYILFTLLKNTVKRRSNKRRAPPKWPTALPFKIIFRPTDTQRTVCSYCVCVPRNKAFMDHGMSNHHKSISYPGPCPLRSAPLVPQI